MVRVKWDSEAIQDLKEIRAYIAKDSKLQAQRVVDKIRSSVRRIKTFPEIGAIVQNLGDQTLREILIFRYRIIYRLANNEIHIVAVVHGARQLTSEMREG